MQTMMPRVYIMVKTGIVLPGKTQGKTGNQELNKPKSEFFLKRNNWGEYDGTGLNSKSNYYTHTNSFLKNLHK